MILKRLLFFLKYITDKLKKERSLSIIICISIFFHSIVRLISPILMMKLIDMINNINKDLFLYIMVGVFIIPFMDGGLMTFEDYQSNKLGHRIITNVRVKFFERYLSQLYSVLEKNETGIYIKQIIEEPNEISHWIYIVGIKILLNSMEILFIASFLFSLDFYLGLLSIIILFFYITPFKYLGESIHQTSNKEIQLGEKSLNNMNEGIKAFYFSKIYNLEDYLCIKYNKINNEHLKAYCDGIRAQKLGNCFIGFIKALGVSIIYLYGGYKVLQNEMTIGTLILSKMYIEQLFSCGKDLYERLTQTLVKVPISERLYIAEKNDANLEIDGTIDLTNIYSVSYSNISFRYTNKDVVENVSLKLKMNKHTAIVGKSGCGKSTLLGTLIRLYDVNKGEILLNDIPINQYKLASLRRKISLVTQNVEIITDTVWENIIFGIDNVDEVKVKEICKSINIDEVISKLEDKYNTVIGKSGERGLSGGQIQRLALARALVHEPDILLLDEVTVGLDSSNIKKVLAGIRKYMKNKTVVYATHTKEIAECADEVIYFDPKVGIVCDTHSNLMKNNTNYYSHFNQ
ncbi:ABC transporter ATP-binding protein [Clostridium cibarium]|uniref:ABC transporter ATP-binding protein n=1 Tax=Clostridium cibarium TaxID=2762247 RepID=A0ABR8PY17_9CLOT|nr:ABC transporter ATP-binding protein [Clostridium cibarium]MBD7913056.1 ABC transporter ATP-binding protein [Clostridium cibarium]